MQHGDGPDETRRFPEPGRHARPDETRRVGGAGGSDETRRLGGPDATRRLGGPGEPGGPVLGGRYRLEVLLGAGGMADVHRATDLRLNRPVAVKIFRPGTDPDGEQRFHEEAQVLANLNHPGLVSVHDFGVEQHRAYLVMELVDGPTLREVLDQQRLPIGEVARVGTDLADVLAYVHEQGVVHRDLKPSNVLLGRDGRVRLADFGVSRLVGATGLTSADTAVGTPSYMAPEQVQGDRVGPPTDVYALGLVLLEAVTGRIEYPGGSWEAAAERLSTPPSVPDDLPGRLRRALLAMTRTDPTGRPTAAQAAEMLAVAGTGDGVDTGLGDEPRRSKAGRNVAIVLGLVALIAVIAAVALTGGDDDPPEVAQPSAPATATEDPAGDPGGEDPATENPAGDPGAEGGGDSDPGFPSPPSFDAPDLPDLPDLPDAPDLPDTPEIPESIEDARSAWERFTSWVSSWF